MKINDMVREAHGNAREKGWWPELDLPDPQLRLVGKIPEKLMLIVTEVAEAMEDYRTGHLVETASPTGKPEGFPSEIADIVIRIGDLCGALGIDLDGAIERKMAYNKTRSHRHGGKVA